MSGLRDAQRGGGQVLQRVRQPARTDLRVLQRSGRADGEVLRLMPMSEPYAAGMYGTMYGNMVRMLKTTVYLPDGLKRRVARVAEEKGCSEAALIRIALDDYTMQNPPRPRIPLFSAGEVAPIDDWDKAMRGFGED